MVLAWNFWSNYEHVCVPWSHFCKKKKWVCKQNILTRMKKMCLDSDGVKPPLMSPGFLLLLPCPPMTALHWFILSDDWPSAVSLTANLLHHISTFTLFLPQIIFPFILSFFPLPLLCHWILFDRKYSRRCGVVVDLGPWQTVLIGLICIHKSIGYLTLANILGSREWWCWVGQVTLSLVMELWWSVTALHSCWLTGWRTAL